MIQKCECVENRVEPVTFFSKSTGVRGTDGKETDDCAKRIELKFGDIATQ